MPRKPRIEYAGGLFHVINRGNYRAAIFAEEGAKRAFVATLGETCGRFHWEISAYCLMSNHFHLCVATPRGGLSDGMRWLQATFAARFNRFRGVNGHLFEGRFKSLVVEPGQHWRDLVDYIHLNPARAGLCEAGSLKLYPWTSLCAFSRTRDRPDYLDCSWMDGEDWLSDSRAGWDRYIAQLELRECSDAKERAALDRKMCRGWALGSDGFRKALLKDLIEKEGRVQLERDELEALARDRWEIGLEACLEQLGKRRSDIGEDKRLAAWKKAIACKLREESGAKSAWLGEALGLGSGRNVNSVCKYYNEGARRSCPHAKRLEGLELPG